MRMNKKNLVLATAVTGLVLSFSVWKVNSLNLASHKTDTANNVSVQETFAKDEIETKTATNIPILRTPTNHALYASAEELASKADLIVVGKTPIGFEQGQSVGKFDDYGMISDYYTITPFQVKKLIKGSLSSREISIIQSAAIVQSPGETQKTLIMPEDYSPLKKNSSYILFLKEIDGVMFPNLAGKYSIMAVNQGKFNVDKTDLEEQKLERKGDTYTELKVKVLGKYKDILATP